MRSTLIKIGPISIHSYGLLIGIGFLICVYLMRREARAKNIHPDRITDLAFWGLLWGIIGTRVLHIILFPQEYSLTDPIGWIAVWRGGLVFQGALPPAIILTILYCKKYKLPLWTMADIICPYIPLGHAFGRLGCFMHGCCFGKVCNLPWAVSFPTGSPAWELHKNLGYISASSQWSLPVHPTQLYSALGLFMLFIIIQLLKIRWHPFEGFTFPTYLILYGIFRFGIEFFRGDHNPSHFGMLTDQQIFCLFSIVAGALTFWGLAIYNSRNKTVNQR